MYPLLSRVIRALRQSTHFSSRLPAIYDRAYLSTRSSWPVPSQSPRGPSGYKHFRDSPNRRRSSVPTYIGIGIATLGGAYYVSHLEQTPYTGRRRLMMVSRWRELQMGDMAFSHVLAAHQGVILPDSHQLSKRVRKVGVRIAKAAQKDRPDLVDGFSWRFVVLDVPGEANALCVPGGKVAVFRGLLDITPTDDALAAVMGHEISHALLRHSAEQYSLLQILFMLQMLAAITIGTSMNFLSELLLRLPYSRKLEREADTVGLRLMTDACYNPAESPKMFKRLADLQNKGAKESTVANMFSTHPMFSDRIRRLEQQVLEEDRRYRDKCYSNYDAWSSYAKDSRIAYRARSDTPY